jgi:hypothetical protein
MPRMDEEGNFAVVSYYSPRDYLHVYGPYPTRKLALDNLKEMEREQIELQGRSEYRRTTKLWVRKMIDVDAENQRLDQRTNNRELRKDHS